MPEAFLYANAVTLFLTIVGSIVWAVRQEGRVNALYAITAEREKGYLTRHEDLERQFAMQQTDLKERLLRIETKIDSAATTANTTATALANAAVETAKALAQAVHAKAI